MFPASLETTGCHDTGEIVLRYSVNVHNLLFLLSSLIVNVNLARRNKGRTSQAQGAYWRARLNETASSSRYSSCTTLPSW